MTNVSSAQAHYDSCLCALLDYMTSMHAGYVRYEPVTFRITINHWHKAFRALEAARAN